jgi:DNA-binding FadR family transcriptional regulator
VEEQRSLLGKAREFMAADMRFHTEIAAISGNPIFVSVSEAMLGWLKAYHTELLIWSGKENYTLAEHAEIIGAIERKDAGMAEEAMVKHLERSSGLYTSPAHLTRT